MSLNSDLQTLKTNIEGVKSTLYTNLTNKGVTDITESDTLTTLADKVSTITAGGSGVDFSQIGYDAELSSELNSKMNADIAYSKSLLDAWNPSRTSASGLYQKDKKLVYAPNIDTRNVTMMNAMFSDCKRLTTVPMYKTSNVTSMNGMFGNCSSLKNVTLFDSVNVTGMSHMFSGCESITTVPAFNTINVTSMSGMFSGCSILTSIPEFNTINVTSINNMFSGCTSITTIPAFDTSNVSNFRNVFADCENLTTIYGISFKSFTDSTMAYYYIVGFNTNYSIRKAVFKDIGYQSAAVQFNTERIENWGVNSDEIPDARQSVIDSLITYSFDRLSSGYPTCTITLAANTKALLTDDEKAQIEAKGFTLA